VFERPHRLVELLEDWSDLARQSTAAWWPGNSPNARRQVWSQVEAAMEHSPGAPRRMHLGARGACPELPVERARARAGLARRLAGGLSGQRAAASSPPERSPAAGFYACSTTIAAATTVAVPVRFATSSQLTRQETVLSLSAFCALLALSLVAGLFAAVGSVLGGRTHERPCCKAWHWRTCRCPRLLGGRRPGGGADRAAAPPRLVMPGVLGSGQGMRASSTSRVMPEPAGRAVRALAVRQA